MIDIRYILPILNFDKFVTFQYFLKVTYPKLQSIQTQITN